MKRFNIEDVRSGKVDLPNGSGLAAKIREITLGLLSAPGDAAALTDLIDELRAQGILDTVKTEQQSSRVRQALKAEEALEIEKIQGAAVVYHT